MRKERRQTERSDSFFIVEFRPVNTSSDFAVGITGNVSLDGLCLESSEHYSKSGQELELRLKHPQDGSYLSALGTIIWMKEGWYKFRTGISFSDLDENKRKALVGILDVEGKDEPVTNAFPDAHPEAGHDDIKNIEKEIELPTKAVAKSGIGFVKDPSGTIQYEQEKPRETTGPEAAEIFSTSRAETTDASVSEPGLEESQGALPVNYRSKNGYAAFISKERRKRRIRSKVNISIVIVAIVASSTGFFIYRNIDSLAKSFTPVFDKTHSNGLPEMKPLEPAAIRTVSEDIKTNAPDEGNSLPGEERLLIPEQERETTEEPVAATERTGEDNSLASALSEKNETADNTVGKAVSDVVGTPDRSGTAYNRDVSAVSMSKVREIRNKWVEKNRRDLSEGQLAVQEETENPVVTPKAPDKDQVRGKNIVSNRKVIASVGNAWKDDSERNAPSTPEKSVASGNEEIKKTEEPGNSLIQQKNRNLSKEALPVEKEIVEPVITDNKVTVLQDSNKVLAKAGGGDQSLIDVSSGKDADMEERVAEIIKHDIKPDVPVPSVIVSDKPSLALVIKDKKNYLSEKIRDSETWQNIGTSKQGMEISLDSEKVVHLTRYILSLWSKTAGGGREFLDKIEVNCLLNRIRIVEVKNGSNPELLHYTDKWKPITRGSSAELIRKAACKK